MNALDTRQSLTGIRSSRGAKRTVPAQRVRFTASDAEGTVPDPADTSRGASLHSPPGRDEPARKRRKQGLQVRGPSPTHYLQLS